MQDVEATVLRAAQANLVTAAAQRVLETCKQAGRQPPEQVNMRLLIFCLPVQSL